MPPEPPDPPKPPDPRPPHADAGVRPARPDDAAAIAQIQALVWHDGYAQLLPDDAAEAFDTVGARGSWADAITSPPSRRHHVFVASAEAGVVGFAACTPATDADLDPSTDAELVAFHVHPGHARQGHGSRMMAAVVDRARQDDFTRIVIWAFAADDPLRAFLRGCGWDADGSTRDLDVGELVHQVRLHAGIEAPTDIIA